MTSLLERVAREMCIADERNGAHSWEHLIASGINPLAYYDGRARAAIAVVLEEAALVVWNAPPDYDSPFEDDKRLIRIAAMIRALKDRAP